MRLSFKNRDIDTGTRTCVMGILNVTPDSFSDGSNHSSSREAINHALQMIEDGADIIDIGGESTRPGAETVPESEEKRRILPVIEALRRASPQCVISVDTRKSAVAASAIESGADIINDISGLRYSRDMAEIAAEKKAGLIIMHMRGTPETMQSPENIRYNNILEEIKEFLTAAARKASDAGLPEENIAIDPGIGFSKDMEQNLEIIANIGYFKEMGYPVLAGPSRKAFIGGILDEPEPMKRIWGTVGAAAWLSINGADIVRVHDVKEIVQALKVVYECGKRQVKRTG